MESHTQLQKKIRFCVRYLHEHGITTGKQFENISYDTFPGDSEYKFTPICTLDFFGELAKGLIALWPNGQKTYELNGVTKEVPWKEDMRSISNKLHILWDLKGIECNDVEEILTIVRRYLSQFNEDTRYLKTLKNFIMKQDVVKLSGRGMKQYTTSSTLADLIEGKIDVDDMSAIPEEDDYVTVDAGMGGVLIC